MKEDITFEYMSMKEENIKEYRKEVESKLSEKEIEKITELNEIIKEAAEKNLYRTRTIKANKKEFPYKPWITQEIIQGIKERKN